MLFMLFMLLGLVPGSFVQPVQAVKGNDLGAPSQNANQWPMPVQPSIQPEPYLDPVDAALRTAAAGVVDMELLDGVVAMEPLSPDGVFAAVEVERPTVSAPLPDNPLRAVQNDAWRAYDLAAFMSQSNTPLELPDFEDTAENTGTSKVNPALAQAVWQVFLQEKTATKNGMTLASPSLGKQGTI